MSIIKNGLYAFIVIFLLYGESKAQFSERVFLKVSKIYNADTNNLLDHTKHSLNDSIYAYQINKKRYFLYKVRHLSNENAGRIFEYDPRSDKLCIAIDTLLYYNVYQTTSLFRVFNNIPFYIDDYESDLDNGKVGGVNLTIFDIDGKKISKKVNFPKGNVWPEISAVKDTLYVVLQPIEAKRNIDYYFFFWLPRGRPSKWEYINTGNKILYTLDKDFNIIKQEEIMDIKDE